MAGRGGYPHSLWRPRPLLERRPGKSDHEIAARLCTTPFVVLAHGNEPDPLSNYANLAAQRLFELSWDRFIGLPSRLSAEASERNERRRLLARVATHGFIDVNRRPTLTRVP